MSQDDPILSTVITTRLATSPVEVAYYPAPAADVKSVNDSTRGSAAPYPRKRTKPRQQYVAAGAFPSLVDYKRVLARTLDDNERAFGDRLYEFMVNSDPVVGGSLMLLKTAALSEGVSILPRHQPEPGKEPVDAAKAARGKEIAEFNQRILDRLGDPGPDGTPRRGIELCLYEAFDALKLGSKLAEQNYAPIEDGVDKGRLIVESIKFKPRSAWAYVVDAYYDVIGYLCASPIERGWVVLDPAKFVLSQWSTLDNDPRGQSLLRQAYNAWNMRIQVWPEYFRFLQRFSTPSVAGTLSPDSTNRPAVEDDGLTPDLSQADVSPEQDLLNALVRYQNGSALALAPGTQITLLESKGEGKAFELALKLLRMEIVFAILISARATMEAEHGSKADSEAGGDVVGNVIRYLRCWGAKWVRECLHKANILNFGKADADEYTPQVSLGDVEHQDVTAFMGGIASLMSAKYFTEGQLPGLDAMLGVPVRESGAERIGASQAADTNGEPVDGVQPPPAKEKRGAGKRNARPKQEPPKGGKTKEKGQARRPARSGT